MKKRIALVMAILLAFLPGCQRVDIEESKTLLPESEMSAAESENSLAQNDSTPAQPRMIRDFTVAGPNHLYRYYEYHIDSKTQKDDSRPRQQQLEDYPAWQSLCQLMEEKGIRLSVQFWPEDQYDQELQTRFASQNDLPMFCYCSFDEKELYQLADDRMIQDITTILALSDGTAAAFFENKPWGQKTLTKARVDGHVYRLTNSNFVGWDKTPAVYARSKTVCIRNDWLEMYDLEMPSSIDEYVDALRYFNEWDPSGTGWGVAGNNVYSSPVSGWQDAQAGWFGLVSGMLGLDKSTGQISSPWKQDTVSDYLRFAQQMVEEGLMDEAMLPSSLELRMKIADNQVGATTLYLDSTGYEPLIEGSRDENGYITSCYVGIPPFSGLDGVEPFMYQDSPIDLSGGYVFTKALKDLQLGADFLDVYYSDESFSLINYGTEGVNYEWVDGERQWIKIYAIMECDNLPVDADNANRFIQEKIDERTAYGHHLYSGELFPDITIDCLDAAFSYFENYNERNAGGWARPKIEWAKYLMKNWQHYSASNVNDYLAFPTRDQADLLNEKLDLLSWKSNEFLVNTITGIYSVDELPTFVEELDELGLSELLELTQERYDRYVGQP